ncbi:(2Fe-2S)-binding protein [Chachezhania sediminis]|uniref:(2Fe-2S)-binding protein n=1 Tax=Chachezhania sediminis TaxID=2599291 RepID=UPI00131C4A13|nr:(2Fe-2S)-binding protein [Chachezhania sediminis]
MIVCHCSKISDRDIHAAIDWMRASDPDTIITAGKLYHALGKSADCGRCISLFVSTMRSNNNFKVPAVLQNLRQAPVRAADLDEMPAGRINRLG